PTLAVADIHGFLALRETAPCPALQAFADACVEQLDGFRAPPSDAELARRLNDAEKPAWRQAAEAHFAPALSLRRRVADLCLFVQAARGKSFVIAERLRLRG